MKVLIIGGVAAGTKTAAKLMRENRRAQVELYTKSSEISYAGCGLPYYVGGSIAHQDDLIVNTPTAYEALTGVRVHTGKEAVEIDPVQRTVTLQDVATGERAMDSYDKLVLATGAEPVIPPVKGVNLPGVYSMRTPQDAIGLRDYIEQKNCHRAVVVGGGFIGLELAENLLEKGLQVTVLDMAQQLMPHIFDGEMARYAAKKLTKKQIRLCLGTALQEIIGTAFATGVKTEKETIAADVVVLAIGIRPATAFLQNSGLTMQKGTILVDAQQRTNLPDVYAVGDCAMVQHRQTGRPHWSAMGSTANLTGRCLAQNLTGTQALYGGCLGTGVVKLLPNLHAGRTGLTQEQAEEAGYQVETVVVVTDDKAHYYKDAAAFFTKLIVDRETHALLGLQVFGKGAVDKMVDIAVTGISMGAKIEDFNTLDFAYAPPFSTAIHPFVQACYVMENKLSGKLESMTPAEYAAGKAEDYRVLDVQSRPLIAGAQWIDLTKITGPIAGLAQDEKLLLVCTRGKRAYFTQNRLKAFGYTNTLVLEGGVSCNTVKVPQWQLEETSE